MTTKESTNLKIQLEVLQSELEHVKTASKEIKDEMVKGFDELKSLMRDMESRFSSCIAATVVDAKQTYVTKDEFKPVRSLVFGLVALVLSSVAGAILGFFLIKPS